MQRRTFLTSAAALGVFASLSPVLALANTTDAGVLRFVPNGDLSTFDPIVTTSYVVRNAALMVFDTLYGVDENNAPQLQMLQSGEVSQDGLLWTFTLREGLSFHDGAPVTAADAVASVTRWMARDSLGQVVSEKTTSITAVDAQSFTWALNEPFPKLPFALGKANAPCCFIMPERIAKTDAFGQISEFIGSGPMRFVAEEWSPGAKAVFERFTDYQPRSEPSSWMAGAKTVSFERIEWVILADPASAAMALQSGEVDWVEEPLNDLLPVLSAMPQIKIDVSNPYGNVGGIRLNHTQPPFNDIRARQALAMAINQEDYMTALMGAGSDKWKLMHSYFTPGSTLYSEAGADRLQGPRDYEKAKALLAEAGYKGEKIVLMVAQERVSDRALADVTVDLLQNRLGMNVEYVGTDFGTIQKRRQSKDPIEAGGWNMFFVGHSGTDCANPAAYMGLRGSGEKAWFGWPDAPAVEEGITEWFAAPTLEAEQAAAAKISAAAMEEVIFALVGFYLPSMAWRNTLTGVTPAPFPMFWGVSKAA